MALEGRIEKRTEMQLSVRLLRNDESGEDERVITVNLSPHGARVISRRRWQVNDRVGLVSFAGDFPQQGRVVYCEAREDGNFCVGLEFQFSPVDRNSAFAVQ